MASPRICVLRAPGTNCDLETAFAFEQCGAVADQIHLFRLLEQPDLLRDYQVLCIPGGFSYGDDIGAGVILANQLRIRLGDAIGEFLVADKLVLGICNGFQVLMRAGLLPGGAETWPPKSAADREATLTWNTNGRYTAVWVQLQTLATQNVFLRGIEQLELPVAHAEGQLLPTSPDAVTRWQQNGQIALCYRQRDISAGLLSPEDAIGTPLEYPDNPNGSTGNIAGLSDRSGRVLGLMPHPERFLHATQHPQWTRRGLRGEGTGMQIFRNAVDYFG